MILGCLHNQRRIVGLSGAELLPLPTRKKDFEIGGDPGTLQALEIGTPRLQAALGYTEGERGL
jgi:hypothetical protein